MTTEYKKRGPKAKPKTPKRKSVPKTVSFDETKSVLPKLLEDYKHACIPIETKGLLGSSFSENPSLAPMRTMLRSMLASKNGKPRLWSFSLATVVDNLTTASGSINYSIAIGPVLSVIGEFSAFSGIFDEFFVKKMRMKYIPDSKYQYVPTTSPASSYTSQMICAVNLFHSSPQYTALAPAMNNATTRIHTTSDQFSHTWINNERYITGQGPTNEGASTPTQAWCAMSLIQAAQYQGNTQFIAGTTTPMTTTTRFGQTQVIFDCLFRCRI